MEGYVHIGRWIDVGEWMGVYVHIGECGLAWVSESV